MFRPRLGFEVRRRLRLRRAISDTRMSDIEWRELILWSIITVWYNPSFLPSIQAIKQFRSLGLILNEDGGKDEDIKIKSLVKNCL